MKKYLFIIFISLFNLIVSQTITKLSDKTYYDEFKVIKQYDDLIDSNLVIEFYANEYTAINFRMYDDYNYLVKNVFPDTIYKSGHYTLTIPLVDLYSGEYEYNLNVTDLKSSYSYKRKIFKIDAKTFESKKSNNATANNTKSKRYKFGIGFGISFTNLKTYAVGATVSSVMADVIYFDASFNGATGDGDYLKFNSSKTYKVNNKINWAIVNLGYIINVYENLNITPTLGYYTTGDIYNDPVGWNTWYSKPTKSGIAVGANLLIITDVFYLSAGINTFELGKLNVGLFF